MTNDSLEQPSPLQNVPSVASGTTAGRQSEIDMLLTQLLTIQRERDQLQAQMNHYKSIVANHQCAQPQFLVEERDQLKAQVAALKLDNKCLANWINLPWLDANKKVMELQQQLDQAKAVICNGIHMSVNQADLLNDGKPIWRAIIFVDDQHRYNSLKVLE